MATATPHGGGQPAAPDPVLWLRGRFWAMLWLSEEHSLSLGGQVTPIVDLMPGFHIKIGE